MEAISGLGAKVYSFIARKSPLLQDLYKEVAEEVTSRIASGVAGPPPTKVAGPPPTKLLDVGTGPGYLPLEIARRSKNLKIIGVDISPGMVKIASRNAETMRLSERVKFITASAGNLPFEDGYFDFVVSTLSLHHWLKPEEYIKEIYRILKENGEAWIYDLRWDTTREVDAEVIRKYGWFLSFFFLTVVRSHSSLTLRKVEEIGRAWPSPPSTEISLPKKSVEDKGIFLKLKLVK